MVQNLMFLKHSQIICQLCRYCPFPPFCPFGPFCISFDICTLFNHSVLNNFRCVNKSLLKPILLFLCFIWDTQNTQLKVFILEGLLGYYMVGLKIRLICIVYSFICIFGFVILLRFKLIFQSIQSPRTTYVNTFYSSYVLQNYSIYVQIFYSFYVCRPQVFF